MENKKKVVKYMLLLKNITKKYTINQKAGISVTALDDISLVFHDLGITTIYGKSGSGKTTLLNLIGGIDAPTSGSIFFMGEDICEFSANDSDNYRNQFVSFVFQDYNLLNEYSVINNIKLAIRLQETDEAIILAKATEALRSVGLSGMENRKINTLSGGQQQRVVIARALAKESRILLCDEPTGNLDSQTAEEIIELIKEISKKRLVILVTHDIDIADRYSDRKIYLKDGKVTSDEVINDNRNGKQKNLPTKSYRGFTVKDSLIMIKDNIFHSILLTGIMFLLLLSTFSLSNVFGSLVEYDSLKAYAYTLQENNQNVIQITKYIDQPLIYMIDGEEEVVNGPQLFYEKVEKDDIQALSALVDQKAEFYPSYFFNKNFQDFTDTTIFDNSSRFLYKAISFREAIEVDNFNQFHMELLYGSLPEETNDVLLYDYMVFSLIQRGVLSGSIEDSIDTVLVDQQTNLQMKIAGILKSDYELYAYIENENSNHDFEETYLASLQSIFCKPEFIQELYNEGNYLSVFNTTLAHDINGVLELQDMDIKKLRYTTSTSYDFIATTDSYESKSGIILTKSQVSSILNINPNDLSDAIMEEFLESHYITCNKSLYDWSIERTYIYNNSMSIIGIIEDIAILSSTYLYYEPNVENVILMNSDFRQIYLSLGTNWTVNLGVLEQFNYVPKTDEFYDENPEYYEVGYVDYNAFGLLVDNSSSYLEDVKDFAVNILIPLVITTFIVLTFFALFSIKKFNYKIGILKALGARNKDIALIFGLQIVIIASLSYAISIPASYALMHQINYDFVKDIHSGLVFFKIDFGMLMVGAIASFILLVVSISIPMVIFMKSTPINIIRKTK